ncbi:MAG: NhaA family Na+:H+ antiporter [Vicingaceae bacterium]|jgi:NhaA family Na+:H+ antiporter
MKHKKRNENLVEQFVTERSYPIDKLLQPMDNLLRNKPVSGILLFLAVIVAMVWVNSPWRETYHHLWETPFTIGFGENNISKDLHHWINDGLMAVFFFVVGLEIKREVMAGDLSTWKKASLPAAAALGGMILPAIIFSIFNLGTPTEGGWGVPMATDIAFTLGVLSLLGNRIPLSLKLFLTALAIVDDLGAVLVIAFFYTDNLLLLYLEYGAGFLAFLLLMNYLGVRKTRIYAIVGICGLWYAFLMSGVHATIAGVLLAFTIPAKTRINKRGFINHVKQLLNKLQRTKSIDGQYLSDEQHEIIEDIKEQREKIETPLQKLEYNLNPIVSFFILPLFALANAGIEIQPESWSGLLEPVSIGIVTGLIVGKCIGILSFSALFVKLGISELPRNTNWGTMTGAAIMAGIGFTMSIFISELAFEDPAVKAQAKLAILIASTIAGIVGMVVIKAFVGKKV